MDSNPDVGTVAHGRTHVLKSHACIYGPINPAACTSINLNSYEPDLVIVRRVMHSCSSKKVKKLSMHPLLIKRVHKGGNGIYKPNAYLKVHLLWDY